HVAAGCGGRGAHRASAWRCEVRWPRVRGPSRCRGLAEPRCSACSVRAIAAPGRSDLVLRSGPSHPRGALDGLARLQLLVHLEEVLDLQAVELGYVVDVLEDVLAGVP